MYAVGRLGSYIRDGVYTVSGPFTPFGGAIDIIVVEQQDGSFRSSPWNVRFGKFQGVLKAKEKVVRINVNGVEADFCMYLDHKGEAYFLRESDVNEVESLFYPSSSGEETDGQSCDRRPAKFKSCSYDSNQSDSVTEIDVSNRKILTRTNSRRGRILGLVFGRKSMKENGVRDEDDDRDRDARANSLERAEIAADLLEVKWSTNLASGRHKKDNASRFSASNVYAVETDKNSQSNDSIGENILDRSMLCEETCSNDREMGDSSQFGAQEAESCVEENGTEMSCLITEVRTITSLETGFGENEELNSDISKKIHELGESNSHHAENAQGVDSQITISDAQILAFSKLEACSNMNLDNEQVLTEEATFVSSEKTLGEEVGVNGETLRKINKINSKVKSVPPETDSLVANEALNVQKFLGDNFSSDAKAIESEATSPTLVEKGIVTETYTQTITVNSLKDNVKELESQSICTISGFSNSRRSEQDEEYTKDSETAAIETINVSQSEGSEEEQLLFGDLDDLKYSDPEEKEKVASFAQEGMEASEINCQSFSSTEKFVEKDVPNEVAYLRGESRILSNPIDIHSSGLFNVDVGRTVESLPIMWSIGDGLESLGAHVLNHPLSHSLDSSPKSSKWALLRKDVASLVKLNEDIEQPLSHAQPISEDSQTSEECKDAPANDPRVVDTSKAIDASGGSWRLWPFRRTRSMKAMQPTLHTVTSDSEKALESTSGIDGENNEPKPKANKKKLRAITPTSEQLASLNLKEGKNIVTFTFSTAMLGNQQVDARIYLWRWDTRIVISDVDGTITKSDVLGQFMPLVGVDWSQTGVAHLFSAIKENGYQLLFLSARAISQAYHTRQFLLNLKQDGKALPDGPIVISPDGLFPSLFREVIRRAPHEFKIACLEEIKALFPSDCNPFYAGFGNRDTDEFSYLKVGIPKGKIFIINPKGEVAVNRRIDTKSYTSLHALVHGMFPSMSSSEQEDYNTWNYWKLPPPSFDL